MTAEILALTLIISGFILGLMAAGILTAIISAAIWHFLPNCAFSLWLKAEVFQTEHLTLKDEQQDWIAKRMSK